LYAIATVALTSNTEQQIDLRVNSQLGLGAYIIRTNKAYWGAKAGGNNNSENYSEEVPDPDRNSWEAFAGTEVNLYDIGDLNFRTSAILYPGITEKGRWRANTSLDIKYDFPLDFYASLGFTFNWDNQPATGSEPIDYVFLLGFGWEW
jgi:hypothetical protein